ncbi:MAG: hypothetical protein AAGK05_19475, partial [Pseudomonadota bacterium]
GGGVVVWARKHLQPVYYQLTDKPTCIEAVGVILKSVKVFVLGCYVPPVSAVRDREVLISFFTSTIDDFLLTEPNYGVLFCGDFNRFDISEVSRSCNLSNTCNKPTFNGVQLDYVLLSDSLLPHFDVDIAAPLDISKIPHLSLLARPKNCLITPKNRISIGRNVFDLRESHLQRFVKELERVNWRLLYAENISLDDKCMMFHSMLENAFNNCIPSRHVL